MASQATIWVPENNDFYFVMTNFCPWITKEYWQKNFPSSRLELLANTPFHNILINSLIDPLHLSELLKALPEQDVLWVAHGMHSEVFTLFRQFTYNNEACKNWMMMPNLAFHYRYYDTILSQA